MTIKPINLESDRNSAILRNFETMQKINAKNKCKKTVRAIHELPLRFFCMNCYYDLPLRFVVIMKCKLGGIFA